MMIYTIGLIFVLLIILVSLDDFIWDMFYFFGRLFGKVSHPAIDVEEIRAAVPKMMAVIVAAYNEEQVLKAVIRNLVESNLYPRSMYHIFLGVYPNDEGTMKVARELTKEYDNVHMVIHVLQGPSSKADNINNVIHNIVDFEKEHEIRFQAVVIHDSEDLVHPYEFLLENYLLQFHQAIQMPVFPLQEMPKLGNVFKNLVSGTYADEFAENHYNMLRARNSTGSFVPSAGTGFVLRRDVLDLFPDYEVFPVGSLTEDYKLSLTLKERGIHVHYALEGVSRVRNDGKQIREFISTRSMFPSSYKLAVRQKTRWIYGITMQSFRLRDVLRSKNLNFLSKYSLYKDWKAKFGNLLLVPGYAIFIYFLVSLFVDVPIMYPKYTFSWYIMLFLSIMMIQRQISRAVAVKNVYGYKSAFVAVFFPPLLPLRMVLGNFINFQASARALTLNFKNKSKKSRRQKNKPKWTKTDHEFLEETILKRFRRTLGDTLLYKGIITAEELHTALEDAKKNNEKLGENLIRTGLVSERSVLIAVCEINQKTYVDLSAEMISEDMITLYGLERLKELKMVPLILTGDEALVVTTIEQDLEMLKEIIGRETVHFIFTTETKLNAALTSYKMAPLQYHAMKKIESYVKTNTIKMEQGLLAMLRINQENSIDEVLYN